MKLMKVFRKTKNSSITEMESSLRFTIGSATIMVEDFLLGVKNLYARYTDGSWIQSQENI